MENISDREFEEFCDKHDITIDDIGDEYATLADCPFEDEHTTDSFSGCRFYYDGCNFDCFHQSCEEELKELSRKSWH